MSAKLTEARKQQMREYSKKYYAKFTDEKKLKELERKKELYKDNKTKQQQLALDYYYRNKKKITKKNRAKREEYVKNKELVKKLTVEVESYKAKIDVLRKYYLLSKDKNLYYNLKNIPNYAQDYNFLKLLYTSGSSNYIYITLTLYQLYTVGENKDNSVCVIRCLDYSEKEFVQLYETQKSSIIPFFALYVELTHASQIYELCFACQNIFYLGE